MIQAARKAEYAALSEAVTDEDKEEALVELKHKATEACQLIGLHD